MSRSEHTESLGLATASVDHRIDLVFIWDTLSQNELTFSMRLLIRYPFVMMGNNKQQKGKQRKQGDGERLRRGSMNTGRAGEARTHDTGVTVTWNCSRSLCSALSTTPRII